MLNHIHFIFHGNCTGGVDYRIRGKAAICTTLLFQKFHMLKRYHDGISPLKFFQATFDDKIQAVKDSKENNSNVIEEYQVTSQLASYSIISSVNVLI